VAPCRERAADRTDVGSEGATTAVGPMFAAHGIEQAAQVSTCAPGHVLLRSTIDREAGLRDAPMLAACGTMPQKPRGYAAPPAIVGCHERARHAWQARPAKRPRGRAGGGIAKDPRG